MGVWRAVLVLVFATVLAGCLGGSVVGSPADAGFDDAKLGTGLVFINQVSRTDEAGITRSYQLNATFHRPPATTRAAPPTCVLHHDGACVVSECSTPAGAPPPPPPNVADPGALPPPTAGTITVAGGLIPAASPYVLATGADRLYRFLSGTGPLWDGGEIFSVHAAGDPGAIGAFDVSIAATSLVRVTAPALDAAGVTVLPRSTDLVLRWTGGDANSKFVATVAGNVGTGSVSALCTFGAIAGIGLIPQSAIDRLGVATLLLEGEVRKTLRVGDYSVNVVTAQPPLDSPTGVPYAVRFE